MVATEIIILTIWFLLYIVFRQVSILFAHVFVFITFIFAFIVSNKEFSVFYLLIYLIAIVLDLVIPNIHTTTQTANSITTNVAGKFSGFGFVALELVAGLVMYLVIALLSKQVQGNIVGVPNLAVTTPSQIALQFKPTFESALGIIENTITFVIFDVLMVMGVFLPIVGFLFGAIPFILPMIMTALILAIFHVTAYNVAIGLMLYAMFAFAFFISSRLLFKDSLSADFAHYLNNGVTSLSRSLKVVGWGF